MRIYDTRNSRYVEGGVPHAQALLVLREEIPFWALDDLYEVIEWDDDLVVLLPLVD